MNIFSYITKMKPYISNKDWRGLEDSYFHLCKEVAGEEMANRIQSVDLQSYATDLTAALKEAIESAQGESVKALYYEYSLDDEWQGYIYLCTEYLHEAEKDDDWACDWDDYIEASTQEEFAAIYEENGFDEIDATTSITLYLIARTVANFGRVVETVLGKEDGVKLPICIAFHDQDPIMRIVD